MIKIRSRCPVCGTRLNDDGLDREVDLNDGRNIIEQDIGGRGSVGTVSSYGFEDNPEVAQYLLERVLEAKEYLEDILGIEEPSEEEDSEDEYEDDEED